MFGVLLTTFAFLLNTAGALGIHALVDDGSTDCVKGVARITIPEADLANLEGAFSPLIDNLTPGRIFPAAQPHTEFTTTKSVPCEVLPEVLNIVVVLYTVDVDADVLLLVSSKIICLPSLNSVR